MTIPASTAAAVNKLPTALNKQLPFLGEFATFRRGRNPRTFEVPVTCDPATQACIPLNSPLRQYPGSQSSVQRTTGRPRRKGGILLTFLWPPSSDT